MNEQEREELDWLKKRQAELLEQLGDLDRRLIAFETRLRQPEPSPASGAPPAPVTVKTSAQSVSVNVAPETTPPLSVPPVIKPALAPIIPEIQTGMPAPKPAHPLPTASPNLHAQASQPAESQASPIPAWDKPNSGSNQTTGPGSARAASTPPAKVPSFEMRLGTYWLVRIGIVMLLTGLVFFGNYAYQNYIGKLGPAGKVVLLYLASGTLLAAGAWFQRKQESLKNYSQVLLAGGLAAVYFTTYAAHHIAGLQVIKSPLLDGALLLGWAGFIIRLADRKKSEVMALFAVLLAYYSSVITHVGLFTLYSNLVLTFAAVFFLVRNRWAALSFASLAATYVSYGFWRFYQDGHWQWAMPDEGLWAGNYFLMGYWILFTAAVFLSRHEQFSDGRRASFLSLNNGAFFSAFILTMLQVHHGGFWKFSLSFGSTLLVLAILARRFLAEDKLSRNAYLSQGLLLVTLGFLTYYTGLRLALVLGAESVILVMLGQQWKSRVMQVGSLIAAALATGWGIATLQPFDHNGLIMGATIGGMLLFNAFWLRRETTFAQSASHPRIILYTLLGLAMWLVTTYHNTRSDWRGLVLACESVIFLIICRPLLNRPLNVGSFFFAALAVAWEILNLGNQYYASALPLRTGLAQAVIIGVLMIFNALWERRASTPPDANQTFSPPVTFFSCLGLLSWLVATCVFTPREYLAPLLALEALLFTAAYYPLRLKEVCLFGQFFLLIAQALWLYDSGHVSRPWWNPALIIVITLGLAQWWQRQKSLLFREPVGLVLQGIYALAVVGLLQFWLQPRFDASTWLAFASLLALGLTAYAAINRFWLLAATGQIFLLISGWQFAAQLWEGKPEWYLPLVPIAALCLLSFSAVKWFEKRPAARAELREPILQIGLIYRVIALAMSLWWVNKYIPAQENCWVLAVLGLLLFLLAGWRRNQELLIFSAVFTLAAMLRFWLPPTGATTVYWANLFVILLLLAQQQFARRLPDNFRVPSQIQTAAIILGGLSLWYYLSRWILQKSDGFYLTAGWSGLALALFIVGMIFRERVYRWLGLAVLACAMGRVVFSDVWKLEPIYRVLSFMALGIVLLVLGFIYNKYQEKIKEWL